MSLLGGKPFLRWLGGKRWLANRIIFELGMSERPQRVVCGDADEDLVCLWRAVQSDPSGLIDIVRQVPTSSSHYYKVRDSVPIPEHQAARAAYLNLHAFNGLWRKNRSGQFNMPPDPDRLEKSPIESWSAAVRAASVLLGSATFEASDCVEMLDRVRSGDRAYVDTPYLPEKATKTAFVSYTNRRDWRSAESHRAVAQAAAAAVNRGARVVISNSLSARSLYDGILGSLPNYRAIEVVGRRSVNSDGSGRGKVPEILIVAG